MSNPNYIELRPGHAVRSTHEQIGFELGRDHARHGVELPAPYGQEPSVLREGQVEGRLLFGTRTLAATPPVRRWLQLRLHAWLRGRAFETVQVTPNYLQQIDAAHCPITRVPLEADALGASLASIDRVRPDAGYAAGNLAVMSARANRAKGVNRYRDARRVVDRLQAGELAGFGELDAQQWSRVAVLCSFVEPLAHAEAATLPMHVLPPNRLRLFNPVQALQAFVSRQLLAPGWSQRLSRFEELLAGKPLQRDFKRFFMALLPRVLEAGRLSRGQASRWAVEDAWGAPLVQQRWSEFALQLTPAQCESLLERAAGHGLAIPTMLRSTEAGAVDGWRLSTRGYVPHGRARPEGDDGDAALATAQQHLAW